MAIELGAKVMTSDDQEIGKIDKVILDPDTGDVHAIVVHKGLLFGTDIEIPLSMIVGQQAGMVKIRPAKAHLDELPRYFEANYTTSPLGHRDEPVTGYGYPAGSMLWPAGWSSPVDSGPYGRDALGSVREEIDEILLEQDVSNAVIREGSTVRSLEGEKVGEVHSIEFSTETAHPTRLVVRKGFIFTEDVEVPVGLIASVGDGVIYLNATEEQLGAMMRESAHR